MHDLGVSGPLIGALQGVVGADFVVWSPLRRRARARLWPARRTWSAISPEHAPMNAPEQEKTPLCTPPYTVCAGSVIQEETYFLHEPSTRATGRALSRRQRPVIAPRTRRCTRPNTRLHTRRASMCRRMFGRCVVWSVPTSVVHGSASRTHRRSRVVYGGRHAYTVSRVTVQGDARPCSVGDRPGPRSRAVTYRPL